MTLPDCMMPDGADPCRGYQELRERAERAEAELAALRQDARRYRWLHQNARRIDFAGLSICSPTVQRLDDRIDALMGEKR